MALRISTDLDLTEVSSQFSILLYFAAAFYPMLSISISELLLLAPMIQRSCVFCLLHSLCLFFFARSASLPEFQMLAGPGLNSRQCILSVLSFSHLVFTLGLKF